MIQSICLVFLLRIFITADCSTNISFIYSAVYVPVNASNVSLYYGTCSECICYAFFSNIQFTYEALNCYDNNRTCSLFPSFSSQSNIRIDTNSKIAFIRQSSSTAASCVNIYSQCGGSGWSGATNCCVGLSCAYRNSSYSQCLSTSVPTTAMMSTADLLTTTYFNDSRRNASTGTYWDCCKLSCGWPGKANFTSPARTCTQNGSTTVNSNTQSICTGGSSYMCADQQPWNVSNSLSYGYAGGYIFNQVEADWCCTCYSLLFTSGPVIGKELIVQVINTAYTSDNMFVLQIPGGGWGSSTNGCPSQYFGPFSWGNQYGGFTNRTNCSNLPPMLQAGCYWRFDWFMNALNPSARFKVVSCPSALTTLSECTRL